MTTSARQRSVVAAAVESLHPEHRQVLLKAYFQGHSVSETAYALGLPLPVVKRRIYEAHDERKLPGRPFVSCRVTQLYETGCCIYFYMAFYSRGVSDPVADYHEIEAEARKEIIAAGGSISHHHGVGKLRLPFVKDIMSPAMVSWRESMKEALDPQGIFAAQLPLTDHQPAGPHR